MTRCDRRRARSTRRLARDGLITIAGGALALGTAPVVADAAGSREPTALSVASRFAEQPPFHVSARFELRGKPGKPVEGRYDLYWAAADRWREVVAVADYRRERRADGGTILESATAAVQPLRVFNLDELLELLARPPDGAPESVSRAAAAAAEIVEPVLHGGDIAPTEPQLAARSPFRTEVALRDPDRPRQGIRLGLGSVLGLNKVLRVRKVEPFRGRPTPRWLEYRQRGQRMVRLVVDGWTDLDDEAVIEAATSAGRRLPLACRRLHEAQIIRFEQIDVPFDGGLFAARFVVGTDGRIHDLSVVRSAGSRLDRYYIDRLRQQEWQPAACDDVPVDSARLFTSERRLQIGLGGATGVGLVPADLAGPRGADRD